MNWQEMHVGIDIGLRMVQSNLYNRLQREEKDFLLNRTISKMLLENIRTVTSASQTLSYDQIRNYYTIIEPLIRNLSTTEFIIGNKYIDVELPNQTTSSFNSGELQAGVEYKIVTVGTTPLAEFGASGGANSTFVYNPQNVVFTEDAAQYKVTLKQGVKYEILRSDGVSLASAGATKNTVGSVFVCNSTTTLTADTRKELILRPLAATPAWDGITHLIPVTPLKVYEYLVSRSVVDINCLLAAGNLKKGRYYKVVTGGTIVGLTGFGSEYDTVETGYVFMCTQDGTPLWSNSGVRLRECIESVNRLVVYTDIDTMLNHAYGTVHSSPICVLVDGKLRVYHNNKFDIAKVIVDYIRPPAIIDSLVNRDCDLKESIHHEIVDNTVEYIAATYGSPTYQHLKNEEPK